MLVHAIAELAHSRRQWIRLVLVRAWHRSMFTGEIGRVPRVQGSPDGKKPKPSKAKLGEANSMYYDEEVITAASRYACHCAHGQHTHAIEGQPGYLTEPRPGTIQMEFSVNTRAMSASVGVEMQMQVSGRAARGAARRAPHVLAGPLWRS